MTFPIQPIFQASPIDAEQSQKSTTGPVRKRTRKWVQCRNLVSTEITPPVYFRCSQFAAISEDGSPSPPSALLPPVRRKSSKKVSIAENLNCDYSDDNLSDVGTGDCLGVEGESPMGDQGTRDCHSEGTGGPPPSPLPRLGLELLVTLIFVIVSYGLRYPKASAVASLAAFTAYLVIGYLK